jgi:hypothetical protein
LDNDLVYHADAYVGEHTTGEELEWTRIREIDYPYDSAEEMAGKRTYCVTRFEPANIE